MGAYRVPGCVFMVRQGNDTRGGCPPFLTKLFFPCPIVLFGGSNDAMLLFSDPVFADS